MRRVGLIRIDLVLDSPGGVTAPEIGAVTDLPLRRGRHEPVWTPPSSVAGSLRAHFGGRAERFFGSPAPTGRGSGQLQPSPVRFLGTRTTLPTGRDTEQRSSTAIDRIRGAAMPSTLHTSELLPAGTTITLYLRYDDRGLPVPGYAIEEFTTTAATWRPQLGRGRSRGHGLAHVHQVAYRTLDLGAAADLRLWLTSGRDELFADALLDQIITPGAVTATVAGLELDFNGVDALHIGSGSRDGTAAAVLTTNGEPIIPASTWKGLLRSRCGYILRSCGRPACLVPSHIDGKPAHACTACPLCRLFGWTGDGGTNNEPTGRLGELRLHDCAVTGAIGSRNHIGIDRFTGGVRRQLLFTDQVVTGATFTMRIDTTRATRLEPEDRGLLLLAIRDLHDGLVGLGKSSTRGYGTIQLTGASRAVLDELRPDHETGAAVRRLLRGTA